MKEKGESAIRCCLHAEGNDIDQAKAYLGAEFEDGHIEMLSLAPSHTFASTGIITLTCEGFGLATVVCKAEISVSRFSR
jgi:hypothetical protein